MKKLALLVLFMALPVVAQDDRRTVTSELLTIGRGLSWGTTQVNRVWTFAPLRRNQTVCVSVVNNNPTSSHTMTVAISQTGDPQSLDFTGNERRWIDDTVEGTVSPVPANGMVEFFARSTHAARLALRISGTTVQAGSPDTADIFVVMTDATSCGPVTGGTTVSTVVGPAASGAALSGNPVRIGGSDGTNAVNYRVATQALTAFNAGLFPGQVYATDGTNSRAVQMETVGTDGASNAANLLMASVRPTLFNGSTWDRQFGCNSSTPVSIVFAGAGSMQAIALSGSTFIRICHISFTTTAAANFILEYGTGTNCGTGNTDLTGAYVLTANGSSLALDFGNNAVLRTTAGQAFCINSSAAATIGGVVTFAQF